MLSGFFLYSLNLTVAVFIFLTTSARTQVVTGNFSPSRRIVGIYGTLTVLERSCLFGSPPSALPPTRDSGFS